MITAKNVCKSFTIGEQKLQVLQDVCLTVEAGEFISLMGPSGSGKSTLLYILGGLDRADSGIVTINGRDIGSLDDSAESAMRRKDIGFVFQAYNLIDNLTVEENVLIPALLNGKKRSETNDSLEEMLRAVGLFDHRHHRPMELSGGQQQRTAIARALINQPKVVFADEPIGNLDSKTGVGILELLSRVNRQYGITILLVTHSEESAKYGSRIVRLRDGQIQEDEIT